MEHSAEQGLRVHFLSSLGGLVVLAGLEQLNPDLLLGILLDAKAHLKESCSDAEVAQLRESGSALLKERATEKKVWRSFKKAQDLRQIFFTGDELQTLDALLLYSANKSTRELLNKIRKARSNRG